MEQSPRHAALRGIQFCSCTSTSRGLHAYRVLTFLVLIPKTFEAKYMVGAVDPRHGRGVVVSRDTLLARRVGLSTWRSSASWTLRSCILLKVGWAGDVFVDPKAFRSRARAGRPRQSDGPALPVQFLSRVLKAGFNTIEEQKYIRFQVIAGLCSWIELRVVDARAFGSLDNRD